MENRSYSCFFFFFAELQMHLDRTDTATDVAEMSTGEAKHSLTHIMLM